MENVDVINDLEKRSVSEGRLNAFKAINALADKYQFDSALSFKNGLNVNVYPNPTKGLVHIDISMSDKLSCIHEVGYSGKKSIYLNLMNGTGNMTWPTREIRIDRGLHKYNFNMLSLPVGVYYLQLYSNEFKYVETIKVVKY